MSILKEVENLSGTELNFQGQSALVGFGNVVDEIVQFTGLMTVQTAWPEATC
jgi:hypothetical protein